MPRRFVLLVCLLAALAVPAAALGQGSPFQPLPPAQTTPQPAPAVTTASTTDDSGLDAWQQILIFAGGGILLLGIAWAILTDARNVAPAEEPTEELEAARVRKEEDLKRRKARNRAAAKRSRQARKKNR